MYDLLLKGGRVIDPSTGLDGVTDIAVAGGVIARIAGAKLEVTRAVVPFATVKRGQVFTPDWGPRPWGWEPDRVLPAGPSSGGCC